jgi:hypothetical protein
MRHQYTPIFRDVLTSRVWAAAPATRAVWLWFQLTADPEGFVCSDTSGVAIGAHVSESEARAAIEMLEMPAPEDEGDTPYQGRIIQRVRRGWLVLSFVEDRERAKAEAQKARNRRYMQRVRAEAKAHANDTVDPQAPEVDAPKPKPKPSLSEEGSPQPPGYVVVSPAVMRRIPGDWQLGDELVAEARAAGVKDPAAHLARLKQGPIGGQRGVFPDQLADYIRSQFGKWRTWEETDRAKAASTGERQPGPQSVRHGGWGLHPNMRAQDFCEKHGLDERTEFRAFLQSGAVDAVFSHSEADKLFAKYLKGRAKRGKAAA